MGSAAGLAAGAPLGIFGRGSPLPGRWRVAAEGLPVTEWALKLLLNSHSTNPRATLLINPPFGHSSGCLSRWSLLPLAVPVRVTVAGSASGNCQWQVNTTT